MMKYSLLVVAAMLFVACGGDSVRDGSKGPSSSSVLRGTSSDGSSSVDVQLEAIKQYNVEGVAVDIALSEDGRTAYIATGDAGLEVIDVSTPEYPKFIFRDDLPEYANFVEVHDGVVYVGYVPEGQGASYSIRAYDVQNPYRPYYIGSRQNSGRVAHSEATQGAYYYSVSQDGLEIYRYRDARSVSRVASYYLHDTPYAVAVHNKYIFIANGRVGLTILKSNINETVTQIH